MELPIIEPAPVVTEHAAVFRDLCENLCQFRHFQPYLTGLIVLPHKSMANIARCILESADTTNLSRFFSEAPWREDAVNRRRLRFMLQQTKPHRRRASLLAIDESPVRTRGQPLRLCRPPLPPSRRHLPLGA
jgi:SRSO17 transposase